MINDIVLPDKLTAMKKLCLVSLLLIFFSSFLQAQLSITKMVGKDANKYKLGYCLFAFYDFPLNEYGNRSFRLELMDLAYFRGKENNMEINGYPTTNDKGYISIKAGYKYIFSESRTGFYVEPAAGYCRVADANDYESEGSHGDGVALAFETGYSLEVGQRGHIFNVGLKYEADIAGSKISSVGLRFSYAFNMFRKKDY